MAAAARRVLLMHGNPFTHLSWHKFAPRLAQEFTVVATDLRGYGNSEKPPGGDDHAGYSFRAMAQDQVEVMAALGFERFMAAGHDRGARVLHRMCLDHPDKVERAAILDIIPQHHLLNNVTREWGTFSWHWFFMIQPYDLPERLMGADPDFYHPEEARQDQAGPELLRQGCARRIYALLPQSRDHPRHVRGLPRDLRGRSRHGHARISPPAARSPARCCSCGARPAGSGATTSRPRSGRATRPTSAAPRRCPAAITSREEAPEETYRELREFFAATG